MSAIPVELDQNVITKYVNKEEWELLQIQLSKTFKLTLNSDGRPKA